MKRKKKLKRFICGEGLVEVLHYAMGTNPSLHIEWEGFVKLWGRIALHFGEEFVKKDSFDPGLPLLPHVGIAVHLGRRESLIPSP